MSALITNRPPAPDAERRALLARVRSTGAQGGPISPHRAIATLDLASSDVVLAATLTVVATAVYLASLGLVARLWTAIFTWLAGPLGLTAGVGLRTLSVASMVPVALPYFLTPATAPDQLTWWIAVVVTVLLLVGSLLLRGAWMPLGYALRFAVAVQTSALLYFAIAPQAFPYDLGSYISGMLLIGATLIAITPLVLGLTFYVIDVSWSRKILLTVLVMGHLIVLVPFQYALEGALIVRCSLIVLPVAFVMFGLLPEIMVLIALYGWGMSWQPLRTRGQRQ